MMKPSKGDAAAFNTWHPPHAIIFRAHLFVSTDSAHGKLVDFPTHPGSRDSKDWAAFAAVLDLSARCSDIGEGQAAACAAGTPSRFTHSGAAWRTRQKPRLSFWAAGRPARRLPSMRLAPCSNPC